MRTSVIRPIKAALAVACAAILLPHAAVAQDHGSHAPGDEKSRQEGSAHGDHHGDHGTAPAPDAGHMHGMEHGAIPEASHGHEPAAPAGDGQAAGKQKADAATSVEHGAAHGASSDPQTHMKHDAATADSMSGTKAGFAPGMKMGRMQGGRAPHDARDPDAYSGGLRRQPMHGMEMADDEPFGSLAVNELEYREARHGGHGQSMDLEAWYGGDYSKAWLKVEGERRGGHLENLRTEVLWDRVASTFWSTQLGLRHDSGAGPSRDWLAFGVRGLAPYWIHVDAAVYAGGHGALAARAEARYDLLLTQRLVLQPKAEANLYSKNDASRRIGSGLSDFELGLRLRYEIRRQFAPYVGVVWKRLYGNTADYARQEGERTRETEYVAGVRFWF